MVDPTRRAYYLKHVYRKSLKEAEIKRQKKIKAVVYKGGKCEKCGGVFHPCVYDFHHTDPSNKEARGSQFLCWSWERIKSEIDKCQLLCSNCHRLEHCSYVDGYNNKKGKTMNETNQITVETLPLVDAPAVQPEVKADVEYVQTPEQTGAKDEVVA